jgi:type II secretion system protein L
MMVLRVLLTAAPAADRAEAWALFDADGRCLRTGHDLPAARPKADRVEVVLAAAQVRVARITLPPLPSSRVADAARFALEDQLAGSDGTHHVAVSAQARDGGIRVAVASRSLLASIAGRSQGVARILAEPELALPAANWIWCARDTDAAGFVCRPDGSAFPVDAPPPDGGLPSELTLALAQARRSVSAPSCIRVDAPIAASLFSRWQRETGVDFQPGSPWRWEAAPPAAFAGAIDLLPASPVAPAASRTGLARLFVPACTLVAAALFIHVVATVGEWTSLRYEAWRTEREWIAIAAAAGVPPDASPSPVAARTALARRYAALRHAQGLPAPDDALSLLARATPALAALPAGAVKSAAYADGHWTLDLLRPDAATIADVDARLRAAGVPALVASSATGTRIRFGGP